MYQTFKAVRALLLAVVVLTGVAVTATAQQATPTSTAGQDQEMRTFPATINEGTCDQPGTVWYELAPVGIPEGGQIVAAPAVPAYESVTTIPDVELDNFANGKYVLAVARSQDEPQAIVACGFVGGTRFDDSLLFSLLPKGDSPDFGGVAIMTQTGADVSVTVHLMSGAQNSDSTPVSQSSPVSSPAATPGLMSTEAPESSGDAGQTEFEVNMVDIAFDPTEITIPAGTDVTFTLSNNGAAVHDFNVDELGVQSGDVDPGGSTTVTINAAAGEYQYYCSIPGHKEAGMVGKIIVQ